MLSRLEIARFIWIFGGFALMLAASLAFGSDRAEADTALASWYGSELAGNPTASGEPYDPYGYTAAHKSLPLGTDLVVRYGGQSVQVTVNDRGPYVGGRDLDLSQGAAEAVGLTHAGVDYVKYSRVGAGGYGGGGYDRDRPHRDRQHRVDRSYDSYDAGGGYGGGGDGAYVIQSGDTLYEISAELGVSVNYLMNANGIEDPNVIYAGQTIYY